MAVLALSGVEGAAYLQFLEQTYPVLRSTAAAQHAKTFHSNALLARKGRAAAIARIYRRYRLISVAATVGTHLFPSTPYSDRSALPKRRQRRANDAWAEQRK